METTSLHSPQAPCFPALNIVFIEKVNPNSGLSPYTAVPGCLQTAAHCSALPLVTESRIDAGEIATKCLRQLLEKAIRSFWCSVSLPGRASNKPAGIRASGISDLRLLMFSIASTICSLLSGYWTVVLAQYLTGFFSLPYFFSVGGCALSHCWQCTHLRGFLYMCLSGILWFGLFQHVITEYKVGHFIAFLLFSVLQFLWCLNSFWDQFWRLVTCRVQ